MLFKSINFVMTATAVAALVACGGGGGGGGGTPLPNNYTGYYYDAPTQGLSYSANPSGLTGITDSTGSFKFQAGDAVSFAVNTGSGININAGSVMPSTPTSTSTPSYVSVLSLPNGVAIAQSLQSLGGTGNIINVSAVSLTSIQAQAVNSYISSNGTTTAPQQLSVPIDTALLNAASSLSSVPSQTPTITASAFINGTTGIFQGVVNVTGVTSNGAQIAFKEVGLGYFNPNGNHYKLCTNTPVISPVNYTANQINNKCSIPQTGVTNDSTWTVPSGTQNQIVQNQIGGDNQVIGTTITGSNLSSAGKLISSISQVSVTNVGSLPNGLTATGSLRAIQSALTISSLANKTLIITADLNSQCTGSNGQVKYDFSSDGAAYIKSCATTSNTNILTSIVGVASNVVNLPGIISLTDSLVSVGDVIYFGITIDSTISSGTAGYVTTGTPSCTPANLTSCGKVGFVPFSTQ